MWVYLLEFEFFATPGDRLFLEREARLISSRYGLVRFRFDRLRMRHRLRNLAFRDFVDVVRHYEETFALCRRYYHEGGLQPSEPLPTDATVAGVDGSDTEFVFVGMLNAVFALAARGAITRDVIDGWRARAALPDPVKSWLDFVDALFVSQTLDAGTEMQDVSRPWPLWVVASIRYVIDDNVSPARLLMTHDYWARAIPQSDCQTFALSDIELLVTREWVSMCDRPFLLCIPATTVPALRLACSGASRGWRKIGEVLMAACNAVSGSIPVDMRDRIKRLASG